MMKTLYPELQDGPNVKLYEDIKGMRYNLFFIDHREPEMEDP